MVVCHVLLGLVKPIFCLRGRFRGAGHRGPGQSWASSANQYSEVEFSDIWDQERGWTKGDDGRDIFSGPDRAILFLFDFCVQEGETRVISVG